MANTMVDMLIIWKWHGKFNKEQKAWLDANCFGGSYTVIRLLKEIGAPKKEEQLE